MKNGKLLSLVMAITITGSTFAHQFDFANINNWSVRKLEKITYNDRVINKFGAESCRAYLAPDTNASNDILSDVIPGKDIDHVWQNGLIVDGDICQQMAIEMIGAHELNASWNSIEQEVFENNTIMTLTNGERIEFEGFHYSLYNGYLFEDNEGDLYPERY